LCLVQDIQDYVCLTFRTPCRYLQCYCDNYRVSGTPEKLDHETQLTATSLCLVHEYYVSFSGHRVDTYSVTHTVHGLNGSKSHTVRDTNVRQHMDDEILNTVKL